MSDTVYLRDIPLDQAWSRFTQALDSSGIGGPLSAEQVPLEAALGRVTAEAIWARVSSPHYHAAAMDGYALASASTRGANERSPVTLEIDRQAQYVDTGDPMPEWADAVVPIEEVEPQGPAADRRSLVAILLRSPVAPWSHVRPMGEDMVATELVLPAGQVLRPVDLGVLAGSGHATVSVRRRPRVWIIPTGSELVPAGTPVKAGEIIEYNSLVLASQVEDWGGEARRLPIVRDDLDELSQAIAGAAAEADLILINAGSSAGSEDFTARAVQAQGQLLVHGVAVRPGHPVILGIVSAGPRRVAAIGVPGYPVSAALTGEIFVEPLLARWLGRPPLERPMLEASITRKVHSSIGDDEYLRVSVGRVGDRVVAAPLARGAGVLTSLVRADGIVRIPAGSQGLEAGQRVTVHLYRSTDEIEHTIIALGSHDLTLDLMAQYLAPRGRRLASANVGSLGGLVALRRGEAHLAGSHLLDPASGDFNLRYIREYLPEVPVVVVALVERTQGLIVPRGNPRQLSGLADLAGGRVTFVNRQRGSGTRVLLDYHLGRLGVVAETVRGYDQEEYTHMSVAAAVASGRADCALGIQAAAEALGLSFIPLFNERYDLVIPRMHYDSPLLQPLLSLLHEQAFREAVEAMPGYRAAPMGRVIANVPP